MNEILYRLNDNTDEPDESNIVQIIRAIETINHCNMKMINSLYTWYFTKIIQI